MELQSWRPLADLAAIRERVARLSAGVWTPAADWYATDDAVILVVDVPGVDSSSLEVAVRSDTVTVAGERADTALGAPTLRERPFGRFERSLRVPEPVEPDTGEAQCRGGVLEIRLRKLHRTIDVGTNG